MLYPPQPPSYPNVCAHTHSHYSTNKAYLNATCQVMLPEAIAIVMAPTDESRYAINFLVSLLDDVILDR